MKPHKRILSLLLACLMVASHLFTVSASAETAKPTFEVSTAEGHKGDENIEIPILVKRNPGVASVKVAVSYDDTRLTLQKVSFNTEVWQNGTTMTSQQISANPYSLSWVRVSPNFDTPNSTFATLTFNIRSDASVGDANINLTYDPDDVCDVNLDNVEFEVVNGEITVLSVPISSASATVAAPTKGQSLAGSVTCGSSAYTGSVAWYEGGAVSGDPVSGTAKPETIYTAQITLTPASGESFADSVSVSVNSGAAETISPVSGKIVITKTFSATGDKDPSSVTSAPTANTLTYNGSAQALVTAGAASGGELQYSTSRNSGYSTAIPTGTDAGPYEVWYKVVGDEDHSDTTPVKVDVTINKANSTLVITAPAAVNYGAVSVTPGAVTTNTSGASVTYKYSKTSGGTYAAWSSANDAGTWYVKGYTEATTNYNAAESAAVSFTVNKIEYAGTKTVSDSVKTKVITADKTLSLPALPAGASYAASGTVGGTTSALISTHSVTGATLTYSTSNQTDPTSATITIPVTGATNYNNYSVVATINAVDKTVANPTMPTVTAKTYGGADFTITATKAAAVGSDANQTWSWNTSGSSVSIKSGANTATPTFRITGSGDTEITANFESENFIGSASVTVTVNKATPTVTAPTAKTLTYTGSAQALVNAGSTTGGELQYSSTENGSYSTAVPSGTNAGSYEVWYKVVGGSNYNDVAARKIRVTISKANPDGTVALKSGAPTFYNSNTVAELIAQLEYTGMKPAADSGDIITLTETTLSVGTKSYHWTYTSSNTNYNVKTGTVSVKVLENKLNRLEITGTPTRDTYEYGDEFDPAGLTIKAVYDNGDKVSISAADGVTFNGSKPLTAVGNTISVTISYTNGGVTKTGTVNVTVNKKTISVAGLTWDATGSPFTFDGSEKSLKLTGSIPAGVTVTRTGDKATNAGSYTATAAFALASGYSESNYQISAASVTQAWSITRAAAQTTVLGAKVRYTNTDAQTVSLSSYIPSNSGELTSITFVETTDSNNLVASVRADKEAKTASFTLEDSLADTVVGQTATLTATIVTQNYNDITVTITVTLSNKDVPTVLAKDINKTYDGQALTDADISGTAAFNGQTVAGVWSFKTSADLTAVADSGGKVVVFTPEDTGTYETVETSIAVTIKKAVPTGSPKYTKVSGSRKTLTDAALTVGSIVPAGGSISWDDDPSTEITVNTAYSWTYIPADPANYESLTGKITPWKRSAEGGITPAPEPSVEQGVDGSTISKVESPDGSITTTTTWEDGKEAVSVIASTGDSTITVTDSTGSTMAKVELPGTIPSTDKKYIDVNDDDWFNTNVYAMTVLGLFAGTSSTQFSPQMNMERGMLVTVLYRLSSEPDYGTAQHFFPDVEEGAYYAGAADWAKAIGVAAGTGKGFEPASNITRQDMVVMLYRYAMTIGANPKQSASLAQFKDSSKVSDYAEAAMKWAVGVGIIRGRGNSILDPRGNATRAEVATVLARFVEYLQK